jgi:hypothetical protein
MTLLESLKQKMTLLKSGLSAAQTATGGFWNWVQANGLDVATYGWFDTFDNHAAYDANVRFVAQAAGTVVELEEQMLLVVSGLMSAKEWDSRATALYKNLVSTANDAGQWKLTGILTDTYSSTVNDLEEIGSDITAASIPFAVIAVCVLVMYFTILLRR